MGRKEASSRSRYQGSSRANNMPESGVVAHVILNENDDLIPEIQDSETSPKPSDSYVGHVTIKKHGDTSSNLNDINSYAPFDTSEGLPLVGETVALLKLGGNYYYTRIPNRDLNRGNASNNKDKSLNPNTESQGSSAKNYSEISQTKSPVSSPTGDSRDTKLGDYFEPTNINQLRLYEGDKVIQSRFGQSIRFSGYNNSDNLYSPTIIIRNRQNDESLQELEKNELTEEDINKDGSVIVLSSKNYKSEFDSPIELNPINAEINKDDGYDQMILNSERIIISSKSQEMLFFSKGDYSIISDSRITIDSGLGADLDFGDDVNITTDRNDGNLFINTGDGNILLNTTETSEPLVRGESLVELLRELIDAINNQVYNTPAGPTAVGPTNRKDFNELKSRLGDVLSTLNFTE